RDPDAIYKIDVPNDSLFDIAAKPEQKSHFGHGMQVVNMRKIVLLEHAALYLREALIYLYHQFYYYLQMIFGMG
ncbi:TPA: hypothetical protein ACO36P_004603, partial [Salmonella enterica subsp. enterica serovar Strathcona]